MYQKELRESILAYYSAAFVNIFDTFTAFIHERHLLSQ